MNALENALDKFWENMPIKFDPEADSTICEDLFKVEKFLLFYFACLTV